MLSVQRSQQLASRYLMAVNEAKEWIRAVTRLSLPATKKDFEAALADGVILCKLYNEIASALKLQPVNIVPADKLSYKRIENINSFLDACRSFGLTSAELFEPIDLFEQKRFPKVIHCLRSLSRTAAMKGYSKQIIQKFYDLRSRKV
jgi:transgelin